MEYKLKVNEIESELVQKCAFKLGLSWSNNEQIIKYTQKPYLFIDSSLSFGIGKTKFDEDSNTEITPKEFLLKYTKNKKFKDEIFTTDKPIYCKTKEQAEILLTYAHNMGYVWKSKNSYLNKKYINDNYSYYIKKGTWAKGRVGISTLNFNDVINKLAKTDVIKLARTSSIIINKRDDTYFGSEKSRLEKEIVKKFIEKNCPNQVAEDTVQVYYEDLFKTSLSALRIKDNLENTLWYFNNQLFTKTGKYKVNNLSNYKLV